MKQPTETSKEVMIINGAQSTRRLVSDILTDGGYKVIEAKTPRAALKLIKKHSPDLVIIDVIMPDRNGFQTYKDIKNVPGTANLPVLFLSGLDIISTKIKGLQVGSFDYLIKPIDPQSLLLRIEKTLKEAEERALLSRKLKDADAEIEVRERVAELSREELIRKDMEVRAREQVAELSRQELMDTHDEIKAREAVMELSRQELLTLHDNLKKTITVKDKEIAKLKAKIRRLEKKQQKK